MFDQTPEALPRDVTIKIVHEDDGTFWAQIVEYPGCLASGDTLEELAEALHEALEMYFETAIRPFDLPSQSQEADERKAVLCPA